MRDFLNSYKKEAEQLTDYKSIVRLCGSNYEYPLARQLPARFHNPIPKLGLDPTLSSFLPRSSILLTELQVKILPGR